MKHLNLLSFFAVIVILSTACCKDTPPPCTDQYFADVAFNFSNHTKDVKYDLLIGMVTVDTLTNDTLNSVDVSERYTSPADFRIRAFVDLQGPNIDGVYYYSDVYRDSVRIEGPPLVQLVDQGGSGTIWVEREGDNNFIRVRNSTNCPSQARLVYNGDTTILDLGAQGQYEFENQDSTFNISFQLINPCEYAGEVMRVSSASIQPFDFDVSIGVRKQQDCNQN